MLFVFAVALAARFVLALGVYVFHDGALFPDDAYFQRLAREMADGHTAQWADYDHAIFRQTATFLLPLTALAWLGSAVLPGQLMVAIAGAGAAALTTAIGLRVLRPRWAIAAGAVDGAASVDGAVVVADAEGRLRLVRARRAGSCRVRARGAACACRAGDGSRSRAPAPHGPPARPDLRRGGVGVCDRTRARRGEAAARTCRDRRRGARARACAPRLRGRRGIVGRRLDPRRGAPTRRQHDRRGERARVREDRQRRQWHRRPSSVRPSGGRAQALPVGAERLARVEGRGARGTPLVPAARARAVRADPRVAVATRPRVPGARVSRLGARSTRASRATSAPRSAIAPKRPGEWPCSRRSPRRPSPTGADAPLESPLETSVPVRSLPNMALDPHSPRLTTIVAGEGGASLAETWQSRELLAAMVRRDFTLRYKQTFVGAGWAVLQPLGLTLVLALFFGRFVPNPVPGCPTRSSCCPRWSCGSSSRRRCRWRA